ncbi:hypothetical protein D3C71_1531840 [compost metagenome]
MLAEGDVGGGIAGVVGVTTHFDARAGRCLLDRIGGVGQRFRAVTRDRCRAGVEVDVHQVQRLDQVVAREAGLQPGHCGGGTVPQAADLETTK